MKDQISIHWNQAQEIAEQATEKQTAKQKEKLKEFMESSIECLDMNDIEYYEEVTGIHAIDLLGMRADAGLLGDAFKPNDEDFVDEDWF
jgi:uncharacterized protein YpmS